MAIKELITLEGVELVEAQLARINVAGENSLKQFRDLGSAAGTTGFDKIVDGAKKAGLEMDNFGKHTNSISQALHILRPILSEAGASVGGIGSFARLAGTGLAGLGAALTGTIVVKLADVEEAATKTKASLSDLFGSTAAGEKAFKALETSAKALSTTTADLLPGLESLTRGIDKFNQTGRQFKFVALKREDLPIGFTPDIEKTTAALTNFFKVLRASGLDTAQASAAQKEFFSALRSGGQLTADILNKLPTGTVEALAVALGKGTLSAEQFTAEIAKAPIDIDKVAKALANFTQQAKQSFDAKAVRSYKDAWTDLLSTIEDVIKQQVGKGSADFLKDLLDNTKKEVSAIADFVKRLKEDIAATRTQITTGPAVTPTDAQKDLVNQFAQASNTIKRQNQSTTDAVTTDWAAFGSRFDAMTNQIVSDSKLWTDSIVDGSKKAAIALKAVTAPPPGAIPPGFLTPPPPGTQPFGAAPGIKETAQQAATTAQNMIASFQAADDQIRLIWIDLIDYLQTSVSQINLSGATQALVQPFQDASTQIKPILDEILRSVQQLLQALQSAAGAASQLGSFGGFGGQPLGAPFASGGMVRGQGSTTSDSILAWLSNREFVVNARAVSHYGPDLFTALNAMRLPRDFISRFSMGGLARALSGNRFAAGGQVRTGNPVVLKIDRQSFNMTAGDDVIGSLKRFAVTSQLSSTGRKPRWVK